MQANKTAHVLAQCANLSLRVATNRQVEPATILKFSHLQLDRTEHALIVRDEFLEKPVLVRTWDRSVISFAVESSGPLSIQAQAPKHGVLVAPPTGQFAMVPRLTVERLNLQGPNQVRAPCHHAQGTFFLRYSTAQQLVQTLSPPADNFGRVLSLNHRRIDSNDSKVESRTLSWHLADSLTNTLGSLPQIELVCQKNIQTARQATSNCFASQRRRCADNLLCVWDVVVTAAPPDIDRSPYPVPHPDSSQTIHPMARTRRFHESVLDFGQCLLPDHGLLVWRRWPAGFDASMK